MKCPECGKILPEYSRNDEVGRRSWVCGKCNIKIYKEFVE